MAEKHEIASTAAIPDHGDRVVADVGGLEIAVFNLHGEYHAVANYCVHAGGPLCEGELTGCHRIDPETMEWEYAADGTHVLCPWHGWVFDVETGRSVDDERYAVPTYDTVVEDDVVFVRR
jgi:nitrite reductase/ring-hydroxylating ferredoxin subunit